jgi:hypothetical protein
MTTRRFENPKIHWFDFDCQRVKWQDNFTNKFDFVTCDICKRYIEKYGKRLEPASKGENDVQE